MPKGVKCKCGFGEPAILSGERHIARTVGIQYRIGVGLITSAVVTLAIIELYYWQDGKKVSVAVIPRVGFMLSLTFAGITSIGASFARMDTHIRAVHLDEAA